MCKITNMTEFQRIRAGRMYCWAKRLARATKDGYSYPVFVDVRLAGGLSIFLDDVYDNEITCWWKSACRRYIRTLGWSWDNIY